MVSKINGIGATALAAILLAAAPLAATAQQSTTPPQAAPQAAPNPATFTDEDIDAFAEAWLDVRGVAQNYQPRISEAAQKGDEAEANRLSEAANEEMRKAIEQNPQISLDKYRQIVSAAQTDEGFANRLRGRLQEKVKAE